ncbi:MAG: UbiA family prenyltransferase [Anaerolineae bacterium]
MDEELGKSPALARQGSSQGAGYPLRRVLSLAALTKPRQTTLLLITGVCAYGLTLPGAVRWTELTLGGLALLAAIAGCTALNMVLDRDIDAQMERTACRPLPAQEIAPRTALTFGLVLSASGLGLAWLVQPLFGLLVSLGFALDLGVYTLWLKRRTPLSILWGGISGGMPALAGRALALGRVDVVGVLLGAGVLLWIPAHILTLASHYAKEYKLAGTPVWPNVYGPVATRRMVAAATLGTAAALGLAGWLLSIHPVALIVLGAMGTALSGMALAVLIRPSETLNWRLFKGASLYMLGAFVCLTIGAVL